MKGGCLWKTGSESWLCGICEEREETELWRATLLDRDFGNRVIMVGAWIDGAQVFNHNHLHQS